MTLFQNLIKCTICLLLAYTFVGCAITEKHIDDKQASPDSSTPSQYHTIYNGGILGYILADGSKVYIPIKGKMGEISAIIITKNKRAQWNSLIDSYENKAEDKLSVELKKDSFIKPFKDKYGNNVYTLEAEGAKYFSVLRSWQRAGYKPDSLINL